MIDPPDRALGIDRSITRRDFLNGGALTLGALERNIGDQLARMLAGGGFDPVCDMVAITVNRWPHGFAYDDTLPGTKFWLEGDSLPCETARKPFGRIANADAAAHAYTDAAIDQAHRPVAEISQRLSSKA